MFLLWTDAFYTIYFFFTWNLYSLSCFLCFVLIFPWLENLGPSLYFNLGHFVLGYFLFASYTSLSITNICPVPMVCQAVLDTGEITGNKTKGVIVGPLHTLNNYDPWNVITEQLYFYLLASLQIYSWS